MKPSTIHLLRWRDLQTTDNPNGNNGNTINPINQNNEGGGGSSATDATQTGLIAGLIATLATAAILIVVFVFVRISTRQTTTSNIHEDGNVPHQNGKSNNHNATLADSGREEVLSEIGFGAQPDVSTLGDPAPYGGPETGDASTLSSTSLDYDYQKAYLLGGAQVQSVASDSQRTGSSFRSSLLVPPDDDTLVAQYTAAEKFEVLAPPGMLGLILETNGDGVPVVSAIKPTSVLAEDVRMGDRLLSVDGIDVAVMLASDVSRMIAAKREQPERKFVFARPSPKQDCSIDSLPEYNGDGGGDDDDDESIPQPFLEEE